MEIGAPVSTWIRQRKENYFVFHVGFICYYKSGVIKLSDEHTEYRFVNNEEWKNLNLAPGYYEALEQFFNQFNKGRLKSIFYKFMCKTCAVHNPKKKKAVKKKKK